MLKDCVCFFYLSKYRTLTSYPLCATIIARCLMVPLVSSSISPFRGRVAKGDPPSSGIRTSGWMDVHESLTLDTKKKGSDSRIYFWYLFWNIDKDPNYDVEQRFFLSPPPIGEGLYSFVRVRLYVLGFNRAKVSVSRKKRTSSGTSRSPITSSISCFP